MPDFWPDELEADVHDWTGSRIREDALKVGCRYCHAIVGEPCNAGEGKLLEAFPAHTVRISDAEKTADLTKRADA